MPALSTSNSRPEGPQRPLRIDALLESLLADLDIAPRLAQARARLAWDEVVGAAIAAHARPLRLHNGRLEVDVPAAVWRAQLSFMAPDIVSRLNQRAGQCVVNELVLLNRRASQRGHRPPSQGATG